MKVNYNIIKEETQREFKNYNLKVLRQKRDDKPLNVSYTIEGLKWTQNKTGRFIFFQQNVKPVQVEGNKLQLQGPDMRIAKGLYVEDFIPKNHETPYLQKCEVQWLDKAMRLKNFIS